MKSGDPGTVQARGHILLAQSKGLLEKQRRDLLFRGKGTPNWSMGPFPLESRCQAVLQPGRGSEDLARRPSAKPLPLANCAISSKLTPTWPGTLHPRPNTLTLQWLLLEREDFLFIVYNLSFLKKRSCVSLQTFQFYATHMYFLSKQQRKGPVLPPYSLWNHISNALTVTWAFGFGCLSQVCTKETGSVSLNNRLIKWFMAHLWFWNLMNDALAVSKT